MAEADTWKSKRSSAVEVYYHVGDEKNVAGLHTVVQQHLPELETKLGVMLNYVPRIYVTSDQKEFDSITGNTLPSWSHGVSSVQTGSIVLKSPAFSRDIKTFNQTALHELIHLLVGEKAGLRVPRWLNEGLAQLLSGQMQGKPLLPLSRALWAGRLIPLNAIERVDRFTQADAEIAYLESYQATQYLVDQYGWETLRNLLVDLSQGKVWDEALFAEMETDQAGFEASWREVLKHSSRWLILMDTQIYLFMGATLLVLLAGIVIVRRRRKIYRKWEAEDVPDAEII